MTNVLVQFLLEVSHSHIQDQRLAQLLILLRLLHVECTRGLGEFGFALLLVPIAAISSPLSVLTKVPFTLDYSCFLVTAAV